MDLERQEKLDHTLEIIVVILMGLTALLTAWATWIGSLHGGNQATNYTTSNNIASEGNSEYNAGMQSMMQDMILWSEISDLQIDIIYAQNTEDDELLVKSASKMYYKLNDNLSEDMAALLEWDFPDGDPVETVVDWMRHPGSQTSPFIDEDFCASYFTKANELLAQSQELLEQGKKDNANGDTYGLVTVIYSVALFLLGMVSTMKGRKNRFALLGISVICLLLATIFMLTIPMPTGFSITSFFT